MDAIFTYQQDSTQLRRLKESVPQEIQLGNLMNRQKPVSIMDDPGRIQAESTSEKSSTVYTPPKYRRILKDDHLLVDSSKYIRSKSTVDLTNVNVSAPSVILPNRDMNIIQTDWITVLIFTAILLFASIRYSYIKYIEHLYLSLFNYPTSLRMLQEKNYPVFHAAFRLDGIFYLIFALLIYQVLIFMEWEKALVDPRYFFLVFGMVLLYFFGKKILYRVFGSLFETQSETREYLFNMDNFNRSLGLILLPIVILISYAPVKNPVFIVFSGLAVVAIFNLVLLQRGIFILLKKQFSIFYLFLYLCSLEFLPLLLIYKVVVD